jgi:hypothetical protein
MIGYWNAYQLDILMPLPIAITMAMAMATVMAMVVAMRMICSEGMPPLMPKSQSKTHTIIVVFIKITVANSNHELCLVQATSVGLDSQILAIPDVDIWRIGSFWMFLHSLQFTCLVVYFCTSFDLGQVQMASKYFFTTSGGRSSEDEGSLGAESTERL